MLFLMRPASNDMSAQNTASVHLEESMAISVRGHQMNHARISALQHDSFMQQRRAKKIEKKGLKIYLSVPLVM